MAGRETHGSGGTAAPAAGISGAGDRRTGDGTTRLGLISDTHGKVDPRVRTVFAGVDRIIHAGDVGGRHVLEELEELAPVTAVAGNMDRDALRSELSFERELDVDGIQVLVRHIPGEVASGGDPAERGIDVVVIGHTHRPFLDRRGDVLYVNPGSASRPKPGGARTVAVLEITDGSVAGRIVGLDEVAA